jgi:hypothetical protein
MAVFPDRIVFKNSTDSDAAIKTAIGSGGSDEIVPGEIVLGLSTNQATLYTRDSAGNIISMGSASNFTNPMTTAGDMLFTNASSQTTRLPIGTGDQILRVSSGNEPEWYTPLYINGLVEDTTPQLGGALDVQNFHIVSTGTNDITFAPPGSQSVVVRGNLDDARISLNSFGNNYSVELKAPPASATANYTLTLPGGAGTAGQVLSTDGSGTTSWITATGVSSSSIGDLQDVVITSLANNEILQYDGTNWVNATATGASLGSASIGDLGDVDLTGIADGDLLQYNSTSGNWETVSPSGTDISGADIGELANVDNTTNTLTAGDVLEYDGTDWVNVQNRASAFRTLAVSRSAGAGRNFDFNPAPAAGTLASITSTVDAWVTIYTDGTSRTNDASRVFAQDPDLSSGVIADAYLTANTELLLTPAIPYFSSSNDTNLRVRVRDQAGQILADAFTLTIKMYAT